MIGLTKQQSRALATIRAYHAQWGRVPSFGALAELLGVSAKSGARRIVTKLIERGHLIREGRSYRLNHEPIPADPLAHGYRFVAVEDLPVGREAA